VLRRIEVYLSLLPIAECSQSVLKPFKEIPSMKGRFVVQSWRLCFLGAFPLVKVAESNQHVLIPIH